MQVKMCCSKCEEKAVEECEEVEGKCLSSGVSENDEPNSWTYVSNLCHALVRRYSTSFMAFHGHELL